MPGKRKNFAKGKPVEFSYALKDGLRPQVLLLGNGLERWDGQKDWEALLKAIENEHSLVNSEAFAAQGLDLTRIPFPLQYILRSASADETMPRARGAGKQEAEQLEQAVSALDSRSNALLDRLPGLGADHIMTTNYSYGAESAFKACGLDPAETACWRYTTPEPTPPNELYRLHSCYMAPDGTGPAFWHIHGEAGLTGSTILGHDRYGRLSARIVADLKSGVDFSQPAVKLDSWPRLFVWGDIYVLGFSFNTSEFDLWWLLHYKQSLTNHSGRVWFYEMAPGPAPDNDRKLKRLLLQAHGVHLLDMGFVHDPAWDETARLAQYEAFYRAALADIQKKIAAARPA